MIGDVFGLYFIFYLIWRGNLYHSFIQQKRKKELWEYLDSELKKLPDIIFYNDLKNCSGSRSFNFSGIMHDDISILLDKMGIAVRVGHHCAQPIMKKLGIKGTIRASLSFYNDFEDIDKLIVEIGRASCRERV